MKPTARPLSRLRAALIGWLPASCMLGLILFLDGMSFGVLLGHTTLEQSVYGAGLVATAGLVAGPVLGVLIGFPILWVAAQARSTTPFVPVLLALAAGACLPLLYFGTNPRILPTALVCAVIAGGCTYLSTRVLERERKPAAPIELPHMHQHDV
jgi:hypothetical protein